MAFSKSGSDKPTVLITGADGFLGRHFTEFFRRESWRVIPLVKHRRAVNHTELDLVSNDSTPRFTELLSLADYAVFLAAAKPDNKLNPSYILETNNQIDEISAKAFRDSDCFEGLYLSGLSVFSGNTEPVVDEATTPLTLNEYFSSKLKGEELFRKHTRELPKKSVKCLRVNAPYGPGMVDRAVVSVFLKQALRKKPITLFGKGERRQHFTWAGDCARAAWLLHGQPSGTYHFVGPDSVSMLDLAGMCMKAAGASVELVFRDQDPRGSLPRFGEDKMERLWPRSARTPLQQGLDDYAQWMIGQKV